MFVQLVWRWSAGGNRREGDNVTGGHVYCWVSSWTRRKAYVFGVPAELRTRRVPDNRESLTLLEGAFPMIEVSIPSMEREVDESGKSKKLFRVEVLFNERKHYVLRRNSEFQTLHRKLRKIIHTPDFPSKRNPHLRTKPLEQRKQELEDYIQSIICQYEDVPQVLLDFLHIKHFNTGRRMSSVESLDMDSHTCSCQLPHQRVLGFLQDPYLSDCTSGLPDVVVDGVLQGFYPRDNRVTFTAPVLTEPDPTISIEA